MLKFIKRIYCKLVKRFKAPSQIPMKYKKNDDGSFTYHVNRCKNAVYLWQRCKAGTADWTVILQGSSNEFTTAPDSADEKGDKYRCLITIKGRVVYYSKVMTIGSSKYRSSKDRTNEKTDDHGKANSDSTQKTDSRESDQTKKQEYSWDYEDGTKKKENKESDTDSDRKNSGKREKRQDQKNDNKKTQNNDDDVTKEQDIDFFKGCSNWDQVRDRYKKLMQTYHPDHDSGDEEYAKKINEQYTKLKEQYDK